MDLSLNSDVKYEKFQKGDLLFKEGKKIEDCFIVGTGKVALVKVFDKRETVLYIANEQELVGEDCVVSESNQYSYSAVAMTDCELIRLSASEMKAVISAHSDWIGNILNNISGKINNSIEMISEHRISDSQLYSGMTIGDEEMVMIKKSLQAN